MRRSWPFVLLATVLWLLACLLPLGSGFVGAFEGEAAGATTDPLWRLTARTAGFALVVAIGAMLCGWPAGRLLASRPGGARAVTVSVLALLPVCIPAYIVFYTWWQAWPADSALGAWAIRNDRVGLMREATLVASLVCWSWPMVTWSIAACGAPSGARTMELLRVDGAPFTYRLLALARADGAGLALGGLLVFLATFGNTTCFDLAQVFSLGNELRAMGAEGRSLAAILAASLPAQAMAVAGAALAWWWIGARPAVGDTPPRCRPGTWVVAASIWMFTVGVPVLLLGGSLLDLLGRTEASRVAEFFDLYGRGLVSTVAGALATAGAAVLVGIGLAAAMSDRRRWVRGLAHGQALVWLAAALVPATALAAGLERTYNVAWPGGGGATLSSMIYRQPAILILGHLGRFGFVAALLARWFATREPSASADLRRIDGAVGPLGVLAARRPAVFGGAIAITAIVGVAALGEIAVTARVHPPGSDPLAVSLLNAMHYQRPLTVMLAAAVFIVAALAAAIGTVLALRPGRRAGVVALLVAAPVVLGSLTGCSDSMTGDGAPLDATNAFGVNGTSLGQFSYPRCVAVDTDRERVYVIDKTARVQCFDFDGTPQHQWRMPAKEKGKPTGISVAPDGRVFVADTHYHRIMAFTPDGTELMRFGSYGEEPGQFIYPTDVAFGPEGTLYVSEYGGHDRVQVFSPEGVFLFEFGCFGSESGCFDRPQAMVFNPSRTELYIADSCNHRIVVVDPHGRTLRRFGVAGVEPGSLHYPYGVEYLADDTLLVTEFGNSRLQQFTTDGRTLGHFGRMGAGDGELRYPWGVAHAGGSLFVLDSGNNRVQVMATP